MNKWMQSFADRTSISWWIFVLKRRRHAVNRPNYIKFPNHKSRDGQPDKELAERVI
jgi:hypothetical protein